MADPKMEVDGSNVIQLIQQFLKENGLSRTLATLQDESQVSINTVDNMESFTNSIVRGEWDVVLNTISSLKLPETKLMMLYEHIIIEMTELREMSTARAILRQTLPMTLMKQQDPERYLRIEHLVARSNFIASDSYPDGMTKQQRRAQIAQALAEEVTVVPPSRLLSLLQQAMKWQQHQGMLPPGTQFDLFKGTIPTTSNTRETHPTRVEKVIQFMKGSNAECAAFSPDGQVLVTGSPDGFVEVWCHATAKLKKDLPYQAEDKFMLHDSAVLCVTFSSDSELIASGDQEGCIKIWQLKNGKCIRKFGKAHTQGVTSVRFQGTHILSTSFDATVRTHGIKSGKTLNIFRGHSSFVNAACFVSSGGVLVSGGSDGTVKVWDAKTHECMHTYRPAHQQQMTAMKGGKGRGEEAMSEQIVPVLAIIPLPRRPDSLVVCTKSATVYIMTTSGVVTKTFLASDDPKPTVSFLSCVVSPKGEWIYCAGDDKRMYCFSVKTGKLEHEMDAHDSEIVGMAHHPHQNLIASYCVSGSLKLWKP